MAYNVLIIGAGSIAAGYDSPETKEILTHAHAITNNSRLKLIGFYDTDTVKAQAAADKWGVSVIQKDSVLNTLPDIVCCAVADHAHYEILKKLSSYNFKLVVGEKPITTTSSEASELIRLYYARGIELQINYSRRFLKEYCTLKTYIKNLGVFITGSAYYGKGLIHNGSHMLDLILYLLGSVDSASGSSKQFDYFADDPSLEVTLSVKGGTIHMLPVSSKYVTIFELDLLFEKGRIRILDEGRRIELYKADKSQIYNGEINYTLGDTISVPVDSALTNLYENCIDVIEQKEQVICSGNDALNVLELCETIKRSVI